MKTKTYFIWAEGTTIISNNGASKRKARRILEQYFDGCTVKFIDRGEFGISVYDRFGDLVGKAFLPR